MLLKEVLAEARGHQLPARLRVSREVSFAALTPGRRDVAVQFHCRPHGKRQREKENHSMVVRGYWLNNSSTRKLVEVKI